MTRPKEPPPSLIAQFGETRAAVTRLLHAHLGLLRAEIGAILDQVKSMAAGAAIALSFALVVGNMLYIGGFLFTGEWLFGSMGWGVAHGTLFGIGVVVVAILSVLGVRTRTSVIALLIA